MKRKILYAAISLLIAIGLWVYVVTVVSPESTETYHNITVNVEGENLLKEKGLMIVTEEIPQVTLKLSGNRSDLRKLNSSNITIEMDVSRITETGTKEMQYSISYPSDVPSGAIQLVGQTPERINITVVATAKKTIEVRPYYDNLPNDRFVDPNTEQLSHSTITIEGPKEDVEKIAMAVAKVNVGDKTQINEGYGLILCDAAGNPVDSMWITSSVKQVNVQAPIYMTKELEVKLDLIAGGGVAPENVTHDYKGGLKIEVSGKVDKLQTMNELLLKVELAKLADEETLVFDFQQILAEQGLRIWNDEEQVSLEVKVKISGLTTREQKVTRFEALNTPDGKKHDFVKKEITVKLRGTAEKLAQINESNIVAYFDLSGKTGVATVKPTFGFADSVADKNIGVIFDGTVNVEIT